MASLVIVFVALIAVIGSSNRVESSRVQAFDFSKIIELVKPHRQNLGPGKPRTLQLRITSSDSDSDSDDSLTDSDESDDSDNKRFARLRKDRIVDLLERGEKDQINNDRLKYSKTKKNYGRMTEKSDDAEKKRLEKERIIDLIEAAAKQNTYNNRLTYSKGKKNYGQMTLKADDSDNKRLERERVLDLLKAVANVKKNYRNDRISNRKEKPNYGQTSYLVPSKNDDNTRSNRNHVQKQILEKLFSQLSNVEESQKKPKKRLIPNRLTPTVTMDDVKKYYAKQNKNIESSKDQELTGLEDYSKIYIVLNPQAVQNSKNKNSLSDVISKVLSLSSPTSERVSEVKGLPPRRYKGFVVNDNLPIRRFKTIGDSEKLGDDEKKIDLVAVPLGEITAMPK